MTLRITFFITILLSLGNLCQGQNSPKIPRDFVEVNLDTAGAEEKRKWNFPNYEFKVAQEKGKLVVKPNKYQNTVKLRIPGGILIGVNRGEWGGALSFQQKSRSKESVLIKNGNVTDIFIYRDKIYFIEGLAHLTYNQGALYELNTHTAPFSYQGVIKFEDAPQLAAVYKDQILVVSYNNFYLIKELKKETLFEKTFWGGLYPNSMATFDDQNIFLGMRAGIAKVDLENKQLKFYKYIGKKKAIK